MWHTCFQEFRKVHWPQVKKKNVLVGKVPQSVDTMHMFTTITMRHLARSQVSFINTSSEQKSSVKMQGLERSL